MDFSDLDKKFPPDCLTKIGNVVELQQWIIGATDSNIEDVITKIKNSIFLEAKNISTLVDSLISIAASRYDLNNVLVTITTKLFEQEIDQSIKDKIKSKLAKYPFKTRLISYMLILFLRRLNDHKIIDIPLEEKAKKPYKAYLIPISSPHMSQREKIINYSLLFGENCFPKDTPMVAVKEDDVDALTEFASQPSFNVNSYIIRYSRDTPPIIEMEHRMQITLTLIDIAAMFGSVRCFKYLQVLGAEITSTTKKMAVFGGSLEIIRILDSSGEDLQDCIEFAASSFRNDVFDWLLDTKYDESNENAIIDAFHSAAKYGNYYALMKLYNKAINFEYHNGNKYTALQLAILNNHCLMIEALMSASDYVRHNAIYYSFQTGSLKKVRMLHQRGESIHCIQLESESIFGLTAKSKSLKLLKYLLEETGFIPDPHECPFLKVIQSKDLEMIKYYVNTKFLDIGEQTSDGKNALHVAVETNIPEIVEFILSLGVDSKHEDSEKNTPYVHAVINFYRQSRKVLEAHDEVYKELTSSQIRIMASNMLDPLKRIEQNNFIKTMELFPKIEKNITKYGRNPAEILIGIELDPRTITIPIRNWLSGLGLEIPQNHNIIVAK